MSTIGPVAAHEIDALAALMREVIQPLAYYNAVAQRAELEKYGPEELRALATSDHLAVLVARDADGLTGFCISGDDDGTVWLYWFGVASRARGRGIGLALLAALGASIVNRGAHKVWCDSRTDNRESIAVLERTGFHRVATLTNHWHRQDYFLWEWYPAG